MLCAKRPMKNNTSLKEYLSKSPIGYEQWEKYLNNIDRFNFIKGTRFGQKEVLGIWCGTEIFCNFFVKFGLSKENIGKKQFSMNFLHTTATYHWGCESKNKVIKDDVHFYVGASPFVYAHLLSANINKHKERTGTVFFMPRIDHGVKFNMESKEFDKLRELIKNAPQPVTILSYLDAPKMWHDKFSDLGDVNIISMVTEDSLWQFKLNNIFCSHKYAYIPNICSDIFYATIAGCKAIHYDISDIFDINYYTSSIIPSYHKSIVTETYFKFDNLLSNLFTFGDEITDEEYYVSYKMLSVDKMEHPKDLRLTCQRLSAISNIIRYETDFHMSIEYVRSFTDENIPHYLRSEFDNSEKAYFNKNIFDDRFNSIGTISYIDEILDEI